MGVCSGNSCSLSPLDSSQPNKYQLWCLQWMLISFGMCNIKLWNSELGMASGWSSSCGVNKRPLPPSERPWCGYSSVFGTKLGTGVSCKCSLTVQKEEPVALLGESSRRPPVVIHGNRHFGTGELQWVKFICLYQVQEIWVVTSAFRNPRYEMSQQTFKTERVSRVGPACPGNLSVLLPWWSDGDIQWSCT